MGIVVGFVSSANINGACATNVSWDAQPGAEYFYCLDGDPRPDENLTIFKPTESINGTVYAPSKSIYIGPSTGCESHSDVCTLSVAGSAGSCGPNAGESMPTGSFMPTSYSYNKEDAILPGEESWSGNRYLETQGLYIIRGLSEGSATGSAGVGFSGITYTSSTGNVSAESVGRSDSLEAGQVSSVGGGSGSQGDTGKGDASINYTPLWLGS